MTSADLIGSVAGAITSCSIFPQVVRIYRSRSGKDISFVTYLTSAVGLGLWISYGCIVQKSPVIVWNSVGLVLCCTVLGFKVFFGDANE